MIKQTILITINFYQNFISPLLHQLLGIRQGCRFEVTCSEYAKEQISNYGVFKGGLLAAERIFKCQPFYKEAI